MVEWLLEQASQRIEDLRRLNIISGGSAGKANVLPANGNLSLICWTHQTTALLAEMRAPRRPGKRERSPFFYVRRLPAVIPHLLNR